MTVQASTAAELRDGSRGIALAAVGALVLTPDTLLMRWSEMSGAAMVAWRGLSMGSVLLLAWLVLSRDRRGDLGRLACGAGAVVIVAQALNQTLFSASIAVAPVSSVLFGLAAVPVMAALLSALLLGERTGRATWAAIAAVAAGLAVSVSGGSGGVPGLEGGAMIGALGGLCVATVLALTFVTLRRHPQLPILPAIGLGALIAGTGGGVLAGPGGMADGTLWAILLAGAVVLPVSFGALSAASRQTQAANVSLLMLTETVLGPVWVWLGTPERPDALTIAGGAIVVGSLAIYLAHQRRARRNAARLP